MKSTKSTKSRFVQSWLAGIIVSAVLSAPVQGGGYLTEGTINFMQNAYGGWLLRLNGDTENPDSCSQVYTLLLPTNPQYKELYALLLAANAAGKPVRIYVDGCHSAGYKLLSFVYVTWS